MATTMQPATAETTKQLINYRTDQGVAIIEMNDPPANTYTYEMNRQFDDAILKARMANDVHVIVITGAGDKFFSAGANIKMLASVDPTFKYYFCLQANEMLLRLEHTPKARHRRHQRPLRRRRPRDRHGRRHPHRPQRRWQNRPARSQPRRPSRHRRYAAPLAHGRKEQSHRTHGHRQHLLLRRGERIWNRQRHLRARRLHGKHHGVRAPIHPAQQSCESRRPHQARGSNRMGNSDGVRASCRTRKSADPFPKRRRERRPGRLCRKTPSRIQSEVDCAGKQ